MRFGKSLALFLYVVTSPILWFFVVVRKPASPAQSPRQTRVHGPGGFGIDQPAVASRRKA
jgi:hypothetical protein